MDSTLDPIEKIMGQSVTTMSPAALVSYMKTYLKEVYGIDLAVDGIVERKTFESFQKRYGKDRAGKIVQYVMLVKKGRKDGSYVTTSTFSTKMKWWTDAMWMELQDREQKVQGTEAGREEVESGFMNLGSLR